jgi:septal ring factor EnvC (AmiA/AmiB activator)
MTKTVFTILFLFLTAVSWSQGGDKQKKLEQKKAQLIKEMKAAESLLQKEKAKERSVISEITDKQAKIKLSQQIISVTQKQTKLLTDDIYLNQLEVNKLNRELKVLKEDYANMLVKSYKSRSDQSRIMFILSSNDFLQAYKRMQYMKQYATFRKIQGDELKVKMEELENLQNKLVVQKDEKQKLLTESEKQKIALEAERKEKEKLMKLIQRDQKKYAAEIKKKQQQSRDIDRQIDKLIKEAIAEANRKTIANAKGADKQAAVAAAAASPNKIVLTKEGQIVANNFRASKGKLPWPVEKGYVSLGFGDQPHPVIKSAVIHNSGVEITTEQDATARAVFAGEVTRVQVIVGGLKAVHIQHGDFFTVYSNLSSVSVKPGEKVGLKEAIGKVHSNPVTGKSVLKFMVYQNTTILNPQTWINM